MGERMSTYEAFLKPVRARWNLDVITDAYVTKVNSFLFEVTRSNYFESYA